MLKESRQLRKLSTLKESDTAKTSGEIKVSKDKVSLVSAVVNIIVSNK